MDQLDTLSPVIPHLHYICPLFFLMRNCSSGITAVQLLLLEISNQNTVNVLADYWQYFMDQHVLSMEDSPHCLATLSESLHSKPLLFDVHRFIKQLKNYTLVTTTCTKREHFGKLMSIVTGMQPWIMNKIRKKILWNSLWWVTSLHFLKLQF